ncbi:MAG: Lon protease family protein [Planctomycetota bacterium]|jgi:ATP-dependent Lon protease
MTTSRTPLSAGSPAPDSDTEADCRLANDDLRWRCDLESIGCESTADVPPARAVVGQDAAVEALAFGLEHYGPGQNVFVRGLIGTGRMTLIRQVLEGIVPPCPSPPDRCFVHNFEHPDRPKLISLPRGGARLFSRHMEQFTAFIREDLGRALASDTIQNRRAAMERTVQAKMKEVIEPFEAELREAGLAFVTVHAGPLVQGAIFPLVEGKPVPPEEFERLRGQGQVTEAQFAEFTANHERFSQQLGSVTQQVLKLQLEQKDQIRDLVKKEARSILNELARKIEADLPQEQVTAFLRTAVEDVVENRLGGLEEGDEFTRLYEVNVILEHGPTDSCPIIVENSPTMLNLLGSIDLEIGPGGIPVSDHMMIHAGSLLRADGGYLILDARDLLSEPHAWKFLVRTLRNGRLEIVPPEFAFPWGRHSIKPEPIDINIKVILIGDAEMYYLLDQLDPDFPHLFKVLADFDSVIPRDETGIRHYTSVISRIVAENELAPFDRTAMAALIEHGARIASRRGKLTARFSRLGDIAREASFIARRDGREMVTAKYIRRTIDRTRRRANLPSRRFRELLTDGTIRIQTTGRTVGQINGLAVLQAGQLTYGFPARVTATIGAGTAGVINIEREANLSGAIHTKGFYILSGLLRCLLQTDHPLAFDASIAFEQSYGGIDGDSASGAEICCLLSALTEVPLRQDLAMTGAIDQVGHILAVGAVNEKIEGFFEICRDVGLTGTQGVIIPASNAGDLMLRHEVVEATETGQFHVYAVETVGQALEILTGRPTGERDDEGRYSPGSVLALAMEKAHAFWAMASRSAESVRRPVAAPEIPETAPERKL